MCGAVTESRMLLGEGDELLPISDDVCDDLGADSD